LIVANPKRGEIWLVEFEPAIGAEIAKVRPAVVISFETLGYLPLRIVVPITDWKDHYAGYGWFVRLRLSRANGLVKESGADGFQCKSFSLQRFVRKLGRLTDAEVQAIVDAVALCIGV
jgi:mRNA interferase MazF